MEEIIFSNLNQNPNKPVEVVRYRGYELGVWHDDMGQQFYTFLDGEEIGFGSFNFDWMDDLKYLVDKKLDTIHIFSSGAKLEWFTNSSYRDIKLVYRRRVLKVWIISDYTQVSSDTVNKLISEGEEILRVYLADKN